MTPYSLLRRTRDLHVGIVHLKDPMGAYLALCEDGFAANALDMNVDNDAVPTCLWCVADRRSAQYYWALLPPTNMYRLAVESLKGT